MHINALGQAQRKLRQVLKSKFGQLSQDPGEEPEDIDRAHKDDDDDDQDTQPKRGKGRGRGPKGRGRSKGNGRGRGDKNSTPDQADVSAKEGSEVDSKKNEANLKALQEMADDAERKAERDVEDALLDKAVSAEPEDHQEQRDTDTKKRTACKSAATPKKKRRRPNTPKKTPKKTEGGIPKEGSKEDAMTPRTKKRTKMQKSQDSERNFTYIIYFIYIIWI